MEINLTKLTTIAWFEVIQITITVFHDDWQPSREGQVNDMVVFKLNNALLQYLHFIITT